MPLQKSVAESEVEESNFLSFKINDSEFHSSLLHDSVPARPGEREERGAENKFIDRFMNREDASEQSQEVFDEDSRFEESQRRNMQSRKLHQESSSDNSSSYCNQPIFTELHK